MDVLMHDTDEGITVLPIHLSGVKSDENVGRNSVYSWWIGSATKCKSFPLQTFPGAYESCNFAGSCRYGHKRGDWVLHSCFARNVRLYIVHLVKIAVCSRWARMCYTTCVVSAFLWIFFTQTVEGVKGELMRCHRPWDSEYWLSYGPFSEEMPAIMCIRTPQGHATRAFLCVFEMFCSQKIEDVKGLKMWCRSHSESHN